MHRLKASLLCLLSLSFAGSVFGQPADSQPDDAGRVTYDSYSGGATLGSEASGRVSYTAGPPLGAGSYLFGRYMSGNGVGYQNGYSQFGGMVPIWVGDDTMIGPDIRAIAGNNATWGGNFGLVGRKYLSSLDRTIGAAGYYDIDQSYSKNNFHQGTFGVETLGQYWDARANVYYAPGTQDKLAAAGAPLCVSGDPFFQGNGIYFRGQQAMLREQAMSGFDAEFGVPVFPTTPWLRAYAGAYYYHAKQLAPVQSDEPIPNQTNADPVGFRGRLEAQVANDLLVGVNVTTDRVWGTNVNAMADFRFSGFHPTRYFPQWTTRDRMLSPWQRNWRIAIEQYGTAENVLVAAVDQTTGNPYFVSFVDNSNPNAGDGTFENPFNSFNHPTGIPGADIIIVERGTSTEANPYLGSMKLLDNQILLGEGGTIDPLHLTATFGNCTVNADFTGFGTAGNYPFVSNQNIGVNNGNAIVLANNNVVSGFNVLGSAGNGVFGSGITNFDLRDMEVFNNAGTGIRLVNATGTSTFITDINQGVVDHANPNGTGNNAGGGIFVSTGVAGLSDLQLTNVNMNSSAPYTAPGAQQPYGIQLVANNGDLTTTLTNVTTNGNVLGLVLSETNRNLDATFENVTANNNTGTGVQVTGTGGTVNLNTTGAPSITANGNGGSGMTYTQTGGTGTFALTNMIATGNGIDGIGLYSLGGGQIGTLLNAATITDGTFNLNIRDGIHTEQSGVGSALYLLVDPTQMNQNGNDGLYSRTDTGALANITVQDSTMNDNGANGSEAVVSGIGSIVNRNFINSTLTNPAAIANGFKFNVTTGGQLTNTFDDLTVVTGNGNNGLNGTVDGAGSTATVTITGTDFSANQKDNANLAVTNGGNLLFTAQNSGATRANFSDSVTGNGLTASSSGGNSVAVLNLTGVDVNGNALTGISNSVTQAAPLALLQAGAVMHLNLDTVSVSNNLNGILSTVTQSGMLLAGQTGATLFDDTVNSTVDNNTQVGFGSTVTNSGAIPNGQIGATLYADLEGTSFSFNGLQGLAIHTTGKGAASYYGVGQYSTDGGATLTGTVSHVDNNGNATGADGVLAVATDSGEINFRSGGSTFNNNGTAGSGSGLNFVASVPGPPGGTIRTLMYDGQANGNANNGIQFSAADLNSNVAINLAHAFTAVGNVAGYGLNVNITAANSYNLLIDPTPPPVVLQSSNVNVSNAAQVVSQVSGSFNGQAGNGYDFVYSNIGTAVVSFDGLGGTVNGNAGNGLNIQLTNVTNGAVLIKNYSDISGNGGYGINIDFTKVTNGAIEIDGLNSVVGTTMTDNGLGAVGIKLEDTNLVDGFNNLAGVNLKQLTIFDNNVLDVSTPLPVDAGGSNVVTPTKSLTINHLNVDNNVSNGTGIVVATTVANASSTIAAGATITNNRVVNSTGDGIGVTLSNTAASTVAGLNGIGGLVVSNNTIGSAAPGTGNTGYGINVAVTNTAVFAGGSSADGVVIANNSVTNNALGGINFQDLEALGSLGTANGLQITGNTVTRNLGNGITATLQNLSTANNMVVTGNTVGTAAVGAGNGGSGIDLVLTNLDSNSLSVSTNSIVNNGGNGLSLTQTNVDLALLTGTNDTITGNGGNGLVIDLFQGSNITSSTFTDAAITGNTLNGVVISADDGTTQTIGQLLFTSTGGGAGTISGNGGHGVTAQLGTASSLNLGFTNETIQDNTGDGLLMTLNSDATAILTITGTTIGNTIPGGPQQNGISVNLNQTTPGALTDLAATITGSTLSNNVGNGITASVTGPSTSTPVPDPNAATGVHFILDGTTITANGATGVGFNVNTGGRIDLAAMNATTISDNGLYGVFVVADGTNTIANVAIEGSTVDLNDLGGFAAVVTGGAHLNACLESSSFSSSGTAALGFSSASGLDFFVDGAGSRADIDMVSVTADSNANNGLRFDVSALNPGAVLNLRSNTSTFNNNGQAVNPPANEGDGVHGAASGANTVATMLFYGDTANTNNGDGFDLQVHNSAVMTVQLQNNVTANNNVTGYGLNLVADTGSIGNLLMEGGGTFTGNGIGNTSIQMSGVQQAVIQLSGDFSNSSGDGIPILLQNITGVNSLALVSILEGTTVNGNAWNGINITLDTITNGGVFIGGVTSVSGNGTANSVANGMDGIRVTMTNVANGALTIDGAIAGGGTTDISNNSGNGVNVTVDGGTVLDKDAFNTALQNIPNAQVAVLPDINTIVCPIIPLALPDPLFTLGTKDLSATPFTASIAISNLNITGNGTGLATADGVVINVDGPTTAILGAITVDSNTITNTGTAGTTNNGLVFNFSNGAILADPVAGQIDVTNNTISGNRGDGIQLVDAWFNNSPSTPTPTLNLNIAGNVVDNNANNGINVSVPNQNSPGPIVNLTLTNNDVSSNGANGVLFELAGLASNANVTTIGTLDVVSSNVANLLNGNTMNTFNNNGLMGMYVTSTDPNPQNTSLLNFSISGTGSQSQFNNNGNAGLGINLSGESTVGTFTVSNAIFSGNRTTGSSTAYFNGDGMAVYVQGTTNPLVRATFNNATIGDAVTNNTTFSGNQGAGLHVSTLLTGSSDHLLIQNSTFNANVSDGITIDRNAAVQAPGPYVTNVWINNNIITNSTAGNGVALLSEHADGADTHFLSNNTITGNAVDGVSIFTVADADINVTIGRTLAGAAGGNIISNNNRDGISANQNLGSGDIGMVTALVVNNTINQNRNNGIGFGDIVPVLHTLNVGSPDNGVTRASNIIERNGLSGIFIDGSSLVQTGSGNTAGIALSTDSIWYNSIQGNGTRGIAQSDNGITITAEGFERINIHDNRNTILINGAIGGVGGINFNVGDGIQLDGSAGTLNATIGQYTYGNGPVVRANDILHNGRDGVGLLNANGNAATVRIEGNNIQFSGYNTLYNVAGSPNQGRGINVLNAVNSGSGNGPGSVVESDMKLSIAANIISNSQLEGVYIVNTSVGGRLGASGGGQQGMAALATAPMVTGTTWFNDPRLAMNIINNVITSNGQTANGNLFDTTGLVVRIGSAGSTSDYTSLDSTATNMTSAGIAAAGNSNSLGFGNLVAAGAVANVTGNIFGGNYANDVTFQAFTSTVAPPTTVGTWYYLGNAAAGSQFYAFGTQVSGLANQPAGTAIVYVSDPLARLDLNFTGNSGDGNNLNATRPDTYAGTNPAYYNNNEQVFKSRIDNNPSGGGDTAVGPFSSGTRGRSITTLPSIILTPDNAAFPAPVRISVNGFAYPSTGGSTFRVNATGDSGNTFGANANGFFPFVSPVTPGADSTQFQWDAF